MYALVCGLRKQLCHIIFVPYETEQLEQSQSSIIL